ncbi:GDSL-type esterase/lipase family protein [Tomitella fengzijianii]|uniref:Lipase n=1 Tax=Tomitella fengzijianii TaxID=2597660 RepID=A0A516X370_9ACTN|nr:GDSL-type esterase/lipase family protein [Tomitella fengzijianii]QDQ97529.1 lipase [Tomitella fengzijianii]
MDSATPLHRTPVTPELLRGALDVEEGPLGLVPCRLPAWARGFADPQLLSAQAQPAGVRLAFRTAATRIELTAHRTHMAFRGVAPRPAGRFELLVDGEPAGQVEAEGGTAVLIDAATGSVETDPGTTQTVRFDGLAAREKDVEIWLPHYERVELGELRADAPVEPLAGDRRPRWLHYGSSISQGSNATHPTGTWIARAALGAGLDLTNLGFSGAAMLDPFVARVLRERPADAISLEVGINLVNADVMRMRAFTSVLHGFLDTIREGHPTTPLLVVSSPYCAMHEDTPGPAALDFGDGAMRYRATGDPAEARAGRLTLRTIREETERIVAHRAGSDPHIFYLDGLALFGAADAEQHPPADNLHPGPEAHALMAERFAAQAFAAGGAFAGR